MVNVTILHKGTVLLDCPLELFCASVVAAFAWVAFCGDSGGPTLSFI